jgi:hypothetical protein
VELEALVEMKLNSYRDKDKTHLRDMIQIGLIDASLTSRFPPELAQRLQAILDDPDG